MAANPMTQFEVYRIGPEIKVLPISFFRVFSKNYI